MPNFEPKSFQQIVASMAAKVSSETPISDFNPGSVILTLLEAAAQEDFQQYIQMLNLIRSFNLDTTEGTDLDDRAFEFGLTRIEAAPHNGFVTISDTRFTKIFTKLYAGLAGPTSGTLVLNVDDASTFPASGSVFIGRGTVNSEGPIAYSVAPVDNGAFWTITLDVALVNDHGTDETIILSQFGNRIITAGTEVLIPENDFTEEVAFEVNQTVTILDGEDELANILVTALEPGGFSVPSNSVITFAGSPFTGASVTNPLPFVNGRDEETDQQLRDRIRDTIQSLSRGTPVSVRNGIIGLIDETTNSSIVSANIIPPVILADGPTKVFIDNGRGLEPSLFANGLETIITSATGGEKFFQLDNFPLVKANLISQNSEPFSLVGTETLIFRVGTLEETFTFVSTDFKTLGNAKATEVVEAINNRATIFEARSITNASGTDVIITPIPSQNENMQIDPNSTAQTAFNFSGLEVSTLKLYKNDILLTKDGRTASLLSAAQPFNLDTTTTITIDSDITVTPGSRIVTKSGNVADFFLQQVHPGDYIKFDGDPDSFYTKVRTVVSDTKFILETAYPNTGGGTDDILIWNSPQLEVAANGDINETEIVSFSPNDFSNPIQALASEIITRIQAEVNLSRTSLAVNDTKILFTSNLENSVNSKMQILGGHGALALGFSTSAPITGSPGTLTFTGGLTLVTGTGTSFLSDLQEGQWIKANADGNGSWTKVETIESDTVLYLTEGYRGENRVTVASSVTNFSEQNVGENRDYILNRSNGQIELLTPLVAGDSLTAGSDNTRAFVNSFQEVYDFDSLGASSTMIVRTDGGRTGTVTVGDAGAPFDSFEADDLKDFEAGLFVGFHIEWTSGNNIGETDFITSYTPATGGITVTTGFTNAILIGDRFVISQVIDFTHASDFADPVNATAVEVAAVFNAQLLGSKAEVQLNNSVRLRTSNHTVNGKIKVVGGTANLLLGYLTTEVSNQETNTAFVIAGNSDREGLTSDLGYTLGPDQTLVMILDGDSANKTFSIPTKISETVATGGANTFTAPLGTKYPTNDYFNDFWIYWTGGANDGSLQVITDYVATTGTFTTADVFPSPIGSVISAGDTFSLVPRTAENVVRLLEDLNTTTLSISAEIEATGISGDFVQIATNTPGTGGKVFVTGGAANSIGIAIDAITAGGGINDVDTSSIAGLTKGLPVLLTSDGTVTTGDAVIAFDTFLSDDFITALPGFFTGMKIEFLTGLNTGFETTISSYTNTTGEIVLTDAATNQISINDTFRVSTEAFVKDITGTEAPFIVAFVDSTDTDIDVAGFTPDRLSAIRDLNGLNFTTVQSEGVDGYKNFTGLIQLAQFTIDGLDRDSTNFPGIGAAGTQFEVLTPVLVRLELIVDVTTEEGVSLSSVSADISNAILTYVNSRTVGDDIILSEIIAAAQSIDGVFDVEVTNRTENLTIADGELVRLDVADLVIG